MTWTKISDDFSDDCWSLTDAAFRLHVDGLTWSARKLLDLRISKDDLSRCSKRPEAVAELVAVGWWSEAGDAYVIRHHAMYQRTRDQVLAQQETNLANGRKGGRPPKVPREQASDLTPETHSVSESVSRPVSGTVRAPGRRPPARPSGHAQETHSLTETVTETETETETERDGTGRDRLRTADHNGSDVRERARVREAEPDDPLLDPNPIRCYDAACLGECGDEWHAPTARARWSQAAVLYKREA